MKTRSAKTKKPVQSDCGDSSTSSTLTSLDKNLWGNLQYHIDLAEDVYSKLPFVEFFHLCTVCKDWYVITCKRLGLKEPVHRPFFNLIEDGFDGDLDGILIYNALSRSWNWRTWNWKLGWTHSSVYNVYDFVANEGVVFSRGWKFLNNYAISEYANVFNWKSKTYVDLELPPNPPEASDCMVLGMIVFEKQGLLSSFKVVIGSPDFDTQVYEFGVWQTKPCRVPKHETDKFMWENTGCVDCNGRVYMSGQYISSINTSMIFVYDFENAKWSSLLHPNARQYNLHALGVWNGCIFNTTFQSKPNKKEACSIQVWELVDETFHKWKVYDCMPKGLLSWLQSTEGFPSVHLTKDEDNHISSSFCGGFMLVYSWNGRVSLAGRFCLFTIATKNWQKLNVAAGTVKINRELGDLLDPCF